jgi:hypothetical protein
MTQRRSVSQYFYPYCFIRGIRARSTVTRRFDRLELSSVARGT